MKENITYQSQFTLEELKFACENGEVVSSITELKDGIWSTVIMIRPK